MNDDVVFTIRIYGQEVWKARVGGKIIPAEFNTKGAAQAAIAVERRRQEKKAITHEIDCWCDSCVAAALKFDLGK